MSRRAGGLSRIRPRGLSQRRPDPRCSSVGAQEFRGGRTDRGLGAVAPPPRPQPLRRGRLTLRTPEVTGFIFKVHCQAMDPQHRDRIAFMRLAGHLWRGMKLTPSGWAEAGVHSPIQFFA